MEKSSEFQEELVVQVHADKCHRDEIVILAMLRDLGYRIVRRNDLENGVDLYLNVGNLWDKNKYFDCPTDKLLGHFIDTSLYERWLLENTNHSKTNEKVTQFLMSRATLKFIEYMSPTWKEDDNLKESDKLFNDSIDMTRKVVKRFIKSIEDEFDAEGELKRVIADTTSERVLVLREYLPWNSYFNLVKDFEYIIYPAYGKWRLYSVPESSKYAFTGKKKLPKEWLERKPKGCSGVHKKRYMAEFTSLDYAIESVS